MGISGLGRRGIRGATRLTNGDLALDVGVDFPAMVELRLVPARVRCEYAQG